MNHATSYVKDFISKQILDQRKELDSIDGRLTKSFEHDVKNSFMISSDTKLNKITAEKWADIVGQYRAANTNLETYQKIDAIFNYLAHNYVYSAQTTITQIFSGYLFYQKFITGEEILLYSSAIESVFGAWSYRLRKKSELDKLSDDIQRVDDLIMKVEKKSIDSNNIILIKNADDPLLYIESLSYARGNDAKVINIKMTDIKFEKGHIYAITGGNGSGKSSFFDILLSKEHFLSDFGFKEYNGKISYSAAEFILLGQNLYCPLYTIPFEWFVKMTKFELSNISKEKSDSLRDRILEYAEKFKLLYKDEDNNLNNTLYTEQHDWYNEISGGEKIKVELIRQVFLHDKCPDVLLLDEVLAPLDPTTKSIVMTEVKEFCNESTILIIYHNEKNCVNGGFFTDNLHFDGGEVQFRELCENAE
jgi:ATP-binding cassette subfamily C protein